jgi:hypothetical protein
VIGLLKTGALAMFVATARGVRTLLLGLLVVVLLLQAANSVVMTPKRSRKHNPRILNDVYAC